mgnify:CR=1 FL=1
MNKKTLIALSKLHARNKKLYDEKAHVEELILKLDIETYHISQEYDNLCREFLK